AGAGRAEFPREVGLVAVSRGDVVEDLARLRKVTLAIERRDDGPVDRERPQWARAALDEALPQRRRLRIGKGIQGRERRAAARARRVAAVEEHAPSERADAFEPRVALGATRRGIVGQLERTGHAVILVP